MNRTDNYLRNSIWGIISKIVSILMPFLVRTILIYTLGITYVGLNTLFSTVLQVLSLAELGFGSAMVYSMYKPIAEKDNKSLCALLNYYKKIYKSIGIIIVLLGIIMIPFLPRLVSGGYPENINIYILYLIYLINTASSYFLFAYRTSLLNAHQRTDIINKISMIINFFLYLLQITMLLLTHNYYLYIVLLPFATISNNIICCLISKKKYSTVKCIGIIEKSKKNEIKKQVNSLIWHKLGNTIIFSFDSLVISYFLGLKVLGIYNNYFYIYNSVASLFSIFYESIIPGLGNSLVLETKEKNYQDFKDFSMINFMLTGFCSSCLICLYQPFMKIWQGRILMLSFNIPLLLTFLFIIWHSRRMLHTYKDAAGLWTIDKYRPISEAIVNLFLNIIFVNIIGLSGVILSTIISMLLIGIPWETKKFITDYFEIRCKYYFGFYIGNIIKIITICIISSLLCSFIKDGNVITFIIKIIICSVSSIGITIVEYKNTSGFQRVANYLRKKLEKEG